MDRPRCYTGNTGVEEAITSGFGSRLRVKLMQLRARRSCAARAHSIEMGHAWDTTTWRAEAERK